MTDRSVSVAVKAQVGDFVAGIQTARANVTAFNAELTKSAAKRQSLNQLGSAAGKMGLLAAAGLGAIVVATANFDKSMSNVQAATHESAGAMEDLRAAAIKAGNDTAFSASEAAAGIENLAKAGVSTKDILGGGLSGALDLAAAGELGVAEAAEAAATAMTQFKLSGQDVPHIADLLAAGAGKAQGEVHDLSMALNQSGLVAGQMGLSIEETTGTLAAFASAGLIGSDAGTSLKTMLLRLANPSKEAATTMKSLGINAYDANGNLVSMANLASQLSGAFEGQTQATRDAALATIFGSDAIRAANVLYSQGAGGINDWTDKVNDTGYAAETAAIKMDNLAGDLEKLKGSLETALIGSGEGTQGPLRSLVQDLDGVVKAFNGAPPVVQGSVTKILAATALLGGGLFVGSKIVTGIANTRKALGDLGVEAGKTRGALLKIGLATAGFIAVTAAAHALDDALTSDINTSDLDRDLTAIGRGEATDSLNQLTDALEGVNEAGGGTVNALFKVPGAIVGVETSFERSKTKIEQFDQALAAMVESGRAGEAATLFERIKDATAEHGGVSTHDAVKQFDSYAKALGNLTLSADFSIFGVRALTGATGRLGGAMGKSAVQIEDEQRALEKARGAARDTASSFVGLGDSVNDAKVSLGGWIRQLAKQAEALKNFRINAQEAAHKGLDDGLIASLRAAGPEGALRMKQLSEATKTEIAAANKAWRAGEREVNRYTNAVGGVPPVNIRVLGAAAAAAALQRVKDEMAGIHDKTVRLNYYVNQVNSINRNAGGGRDGDPSTPYASGGYTGDYDPRRVVGQVHGREFVTDAATTAMNRPLLEAMHANRGRAISHQLTGVRDVAMTAELARLRGTVDRLENRLASLGGDVQAGAQVGAYHGTAGRLRAQGRDVYLQVGG